MLGGVSGKPGSSSGAPTKSRPFAGLLFVFPLRLFREDDEFDWDSDCRFWRARDFSVSASLVSSCWFLTARSSARFFWARNSPKIRSLSTWNCLACWLPGQGNCWQPVQKESAKTSSAEFGANPNKACWSRFDWLLFIVNADGCSTTFFKQNMDLAVSKLTSLVNKIANLGKDHFSFSG